MASFIEEARHFFNRSQSASRKLIIINVTVFVFIGLISVLFGLFKLYVPFWNIFVDSLRLPPNFEGLIWKPWTLISFQFMHASLGHIFFNMISLFWFGNILQDFIGGKKIYKIYLLGGICGGIFTIICYLIFPGINNHWPLVGASASVVAILAASATLLPNYELNLLFIGFVKLKWVAIIAIIIDVLSLSGQNDGGHLSHIGGALFGFLYIKYIHGKILPNSFSIRKLNIFKRKRNKLKVHQTITYMKTEKTYTPKQEEIDAILDKISVSGYESLSRDEKEILFKASQKKD